MKSKADFVTNSSSASFTIPLDKLSEYKISLIRDHFRACDKLPGYWSNGNPDDAWSVYESDGFLEGSCSMDNFEMGNFLEAIGIPDDIIKWGY